MTFEVDTPILDSPCAEPGEHWFIRPGATRATLELIQWWRREGRDQRLFFAQLEAVETAIFLREARGDYLQGLDIPRGYPRLSGDAAPD